MKSPFVIYFITLFPKFFSSFLEYSIIKKAIDLKKVEFQIINLRDFGLGKNKQVDDYQYGIGSGMVLKPEPIYNAIQFVKKQITGKVCTILLSASGKTFDQQKGQQLIDNYDNLILISGNYEGVDERVLQFVDLEISIGNYVLTGGELPALIMANVLTRLIKGVIKDDSRLNESFTKNLLDNPVYTKPLIFRGLEVPKILLSGNHEKIKEWRNNQALLKTKLNKPELLKKPKK